MTEATTLTSGIALLIGILHALEPGHGKTALLTYLASGKRTVSEGIFIALTSAITHSLAVLVIALASHHLLHQDPEHATTHNIGEYLALISGALIIGLGLWTFYKKDQEHSCSICESGHHHKHHEPVHNEVPKVKSRFLTSGLIGIATGMIPCPTVVVAYLTGLSTGQSYLGLQSVLLFAIGMSLSLLTVIILFNFGALKVRDSVNWKLPFKWNHAQGIIFILIGLLTAFYH